MRLNIFNGGLHTRPAPHFIKANESRVFTNVDNSKGILTPIKDKTEAVTGAQKFAYYSTSADAWQFSATPTDYIDFQQRLYFSDRLTEPKKIVDGNESKLGIDAPTAKPTVTLTFETIPLTASDVTLQEAFTTGDLPEGVEFSYIVLNEEVTATGLTIYTPSEIINYTLSGGSPNAVELVEPSGASYGLYRELGGYYRRVGRRGTGAADNRLYDNRYNRGDILLTKMLDGTYQYALTFYNSTLGVESAPVFSEEITVAPGFTDLTDIAVSSDPQVDQVRVYRVGGAYTEFLLVGTIANGSTAYQDDTPDLDIPGDLLTTANYAAAPTGLKFLTQAYAMLFAALGDKLRYTPIGVPDAWPDLYFIDFPEAITGVSVVSNGIIVNTYYRSYLVTGTGPASLSVQTLSSDQGCINGDSVVFIGGKALWASTDGICRSNGDEPTVITKAKIGKTTFDSVNAVLHDQEYYLHLTDGRTFIVDFDDKVLKYNEYGIESVVVGNDKLYGYSNGSLHELASASTNLSLEYLSGEFMGETYTRKKAYKSVYITSKGLLTVNVYVDGNLANSSDFNGAKTIHEIKIAAQYKNGLTIQVEVTGTGSIYEMVIDEASTNV